MKAKLDRDDYARAAALRDPEIAIEIADLDRLHASIGSRSLRALYNQLKDAAAYGEDGVEAQISIDCPVMFVLSGERLTSFVAQLKRHFDP